MKKAIALMLCLVMLVSLLCSSASAETTSYTATAQGFGGPVTVTLEMDDGTIVDVQITGDGETPAIGGAAIPQLQEAILAAKSVEIDGVSGASFTSAAVKQAAMEAYNEANGITAEDIAVKMTPGTYTYSVWAFSPEKQMTVSVELGETEIKSIAIEDNGETGPILKSATSLLIPRILDNQSVAVDAITGATASSNGIKQAVTMALEEALEDPAAISAFQTMPEKKTDTVTLDYDVVVVGMGGTGTAAAMAAAQTQKDAGQEVSVLAIDKAGKYGGTSSLTSEMMAINPPKFMEENDYQVRDVQVGGDTRPLEDTRTDKTVYVEREVFKDAWMEYTEGDAKEEMIDLMLDNSGETLDWLIDQGFVFNRPQLGVDASAIYFCVYQYGGTFMENKDEIITYFDTLYDRFKEIGGEYMLEVNGYGFIFDDQTGEVKGILAEGQDGTKYEINAKSVVLATGGLCGSAEMTTKYLSENPYYPLGGAWNMVGSTQNKGEMIEAAIELGAGTYNIDMVPVVHVGGAAQIVHEFDSFTDTVNDAETIIAPNDIPMVMSVSGNFAVDASGKRFTNEQGLAYLDPWKAGPRFWTIWSDEMIQDIKNNGFKMAWTPWFIAQGGVPAGYPLADIETYMTTFSEKYPELVCKADTLEELCAMRGWDPAVVQETIDQYNACCEAGVDEQFGKADVFLNPVGSEGPFYAVTGSAYCYCSTGGLNVDTELRVLTAADETPIPGLYAAGTDTLGVLLSDKKAYVGYGGCAQGWAYTSGRLAGIQAAEYAAG